MIKKEKVHYICLSEKDRKDLRDWNNRGKIKSKSTIKRNKNRKKLDDMADRLKGKPYSVFLSSRYWSLVRKRVLDRDGHKCVICKADKYLQVHHDSYKHHFREHRHLNELMTLCRECHKEHHYAQM